MRQRSAAGLSHFHRPRRAARVRPPPTGHLREMEIPKDKIIALLRDRGEHDKADKAERELPDKVDHEEHSNLLEEHGIDPKDLLGKIGL
jgi:hypothetical protein